MKLRLLRTTQGAEGTFGQLMGLDDAYFTGEEPWRDNRQDESCIPAGTYQVIWSRSSRLSAKYGKDYFTYEVIGVPDRTGIRIHSANYVGDETQGYKKELSGCIALGLSIGKLEGQTAVLASRDAIAKFQDTMNAQPFELTISYL